MGNHARTGRTAVHTFTSLSGPSLCHHRTGGSPGRSRHEQMFSLVLAWQVVATCRPTAYARADRIGRRRGCNETRQPSRRHAQEYLCYHARRRVIRSMCRVSEHPARPVVIIIVVAVVRCNTIRKRSTDSAKAGDPHANRTHARESSQDLCMCSHAVT